MLLIDLESVLLPIKNLISFKKPLKYYLKWFDGRSRISLIKFALSSFFYVFMKFFFISWCCGNTYHCRLAQRIMILSWWYKMFAWSLCVLFTNKDGLITARTYTINYHLGTCIPYDHAFLRLRAKIKDFLFLLPYNFQRRDIIYYK